MPIRLDHLLRALLWLITSLLFLISFAGETSIVFDFLLLIAVIHLTIIEAIPLLVFILPDFMSKPLTFIRASVIDIYCVILAHCTFPFPQSAHNPKSDEGGDPVIFIHGYLTTSGLWFYFRQKCGEAGLRNLYFVDLGNPLASIEHHAETLKREVNEVVRITGKKHLKLVGHSMGGLIAAYYISYLSESNGVNVTGFVSLAAPFEGTPWGNFGFGISPRQMIPYSAFLLSLKASFKKRAPKTLFLESISDWVVNPLDPFLVHVRKDNTIARCDTLGHATFVFSEKSIKEVIAFLAS